MRCSLCVTLALSAAGCGLVLDLEPAEERGRSDAGRVDDAGGDDDAGADDDAGVAPRDDGGGRDGGPVDGAMPGTACEDALSEAPVLRAGDSADGPSTCGGPDVADLECFGTSGTPESHFVVDATGGALRVTISSVGEFVLGRLDAEDCTSVLDCSDTELSIPAGETAHIVVEAPVSGGCGAAFLVSVVAA